MARLVSPGGCRPRRRDSIAGCRGRSRTAPEPTHHLHAGGQRVPGDLQRGIDDRLGAGVDERPGQHRQRSGKRVADVRIRPGRRASGDAGKGPPRYPRHRTRLEKPEVVAVPGPLDVLRHVAVSQRPMHAKDQPRQGVDVLVVEHGGCSDRVGPLDVPRPAAVPDRVLLWVDTAADHSLTGARREVDGDDAPLPRHRIARERDARGDRSLCGVADQIADDHRARGRIVGYAEVSPVGDRLRSPERGEAM